MKKTDFLAITVILLFFASSGFVCASGTENNSLNLLTEKNWKLTGMADASGKISPLISGTRVTAQFGADESLDGFGGVNDYTASYYTDENKITILDVSLTQEEGVERVADQEIRYLLLLQSAGMYSTSDKSLIIADNSGRTVLVFEAEISTPNTLGKNPWRLTGMADETGKISSIVAGSRLTAQFSENGNLAGFGGVNDYGAIYFTDESKLTISELSTTMREGSELLIDQETQYFQLLLSAGMYSTSDKGLTIADNSGQTILLFEADISTPNTLGKNPWRLTGITDETGKIGPIITGSKITAIFGENRDLSGFSGINDYIAIYGTDESKLTISEISVTQNEEEGDLAEQEIRYLLLLQSAGMYSTSDKSLTIADNSGRTILLFEATR